MSVFMCSILSRNKDYMSQISRGICFQFLRILIQILTLAPVRHHIIEHHIYRHLQDLFIMSFFSSSSLLLPLNNTTYSYIDISHPLVFNLIGTVNIIFIITTKITYCSNSISTRFQLWNNRKMYFKHNEDGQRSCVHMSEINFSMQTFASHMKPWINGQMNNWTCIPSIRSRLTEVCLVATAMLVYYSFIHGKSCRHQNVFAFLSQQYQSCWQSYW